MCITIIIIISDVEFKDDGTYYMQLFFVAHLQCI